MSYIKLTSSLIASTVWRLPTPTRLVWITMLVTADPEGIVESSIPGLADLARVSIPECKAALQSFLSPDEYSRVQDNGGKRIEVVDGGWRLLNYKLHKDKASVVAKKENAARRQAEFRKRKKGAAS